MEVIDTFYQDGMIDCYTVVFDEQSPINPYYFTMFALSRYGQSFSQLTDGLYEPGAENEHLGTRVLFEELNERLLNHVLERMADNG